MSGLLKLKGRYYRTIPMDSAGYAEQKLELEAARTAFVSLHCWDIGCPGGPEVAPQRFCVGMGHRDTLDAAYSVMRDFVRPALDAAREAGLAVYHVQSEGIARRHPEWFERDADPPAAASPTPAEGAVASETAESGDGSTPLTMEGAAASRAKRRRRRRKRRPGAPPGGPPEGSGIL